MATPPRTQSPGRAADEETAVRPMLSCRHCHAETAAEQMSCGHVMCRPCLQRYVLAAEFVRETLHCPMRGCAAQLPSSQVRGLVGEKAYEQRMAAMVEEDAALARQTAEELAREDAAAEAEPRSAQRFLVQCPVCFDDGDLEESVALDCDHKLCAGCFKRYLESKIGEAQVAEDELVCPIPRCGTAITTAQVQGAVGGTELWEKFLQFRFSLWRPGPDDGTMAACPTPGCARFVVPAGMDIVECPVCRKKLCAKCGAAGGHQGVTCEAYEAWQRENSGAEQSFEDVMAELRWRRCPVCRAPSERASGCNFIQCWSHACRKRTYWCYVCGKQLSRDQHYSHFPNGPYKHECCTPESEWVRRGAPEAGAPPPPGSGAAHAT